MQELQRARWATSAGFLLHGLIIAAWLSRIPSVQSRLALNPGQLGLALLGSALGALGMMPVAGALVTRAGSKPVMRASIVLMAAALPFIGLAPNRWALTAALVVFGMGAGANNISMNAQAVELERRYRRPILSRFHALFSLGAMAGSGLGAWAAAAYWTPLQQFLAAALVFGPSGLLAGSLLLTTDRGRTGQPMFAAVSGPLVGLGCLAFCILLNEGAMADWSSVYLRRSLGASESVAATGYAVFSLAMSAGRLSGDWLTARLGRVRIVRVGGSAAACGLAAALTHGTVWATLAGFGIVGLGFSAIVPLAFGAAGRNAASAGAGLAAVNTAGYLGFLSGPAIIGLTANAIGLRLALGLVVLLSVFVALLAPNVELPSDTPARSAEEPVLL